jgi:uncharacterized protein (TIGR02145 family)
MKHFTQISKFAAMAAIAAIGISLYACEEKEKSSKPTEAAVQQETQKPAAEIGAFTDARDKKSYRTVKIGNQVWMAENLNYAVKGIRCAENTPASASSVGCEPPFGGLYNWATAKTACPAGWHLPSDAEWQTLVDFAGGEETAGEKLRAANACPEEAICIDCDEDVERSKSIPGTDAFGFAALDGGFSFDDGEFFYAGGLFWSATEVDANNAYSWGMSCSSKGVGGGGDNKKTYFLSVRCIKD